MTDQTKDQLPKRKTGSWKGKLLGGILGLALGMLLIRFRNLLPPLPVVLACLWACWFPGALVHEAGHVVAGALAGFRCVQVSILFLSFTRGIAGWTLEISREPLESASAVCYPTHGRDLRRRLLIMVAGGPLVSLLSGTVAVLWLTRTATFPLGWLGCAILFFALFSLFIGTAGFLSIKGKHLPSDGARIRMLLRAGPEADRWCGLALLGAASAQGARPRELDPELILRVTSVSDESLDALSAVRFHYNWALDSGRTAEAAEVLCRIVENRQKWPEPLRPVWLCEAAWFEAAFRKDVAAAQKWRDHPENRKTRLSAGARWKAEAAIAALEGRFEEADSAAREALKELDRSPDLGVVKAIRESLARITTRLQGGDRENSRSTVLP
jgi:hypothetical protein